MRLSTPEILLIFGIVVILFGVGRISKIAGEMGKGIRAFRSGLKDEEKQAEETKVEETKGKEQNQE